MTLVNGTGSRAEVDRGADPALARRSAAFWMTDIALEIWIDVEQVPVTIQLAGTLAHATGSNVVSVVEELIADGCRDFELQTSGLIVSDAGGADFLVDLERVVQSCGGHLLWGG